MKYVNQLVQVKISMLREIIERGGSGDLSIGDVKFLIKVLPDRSLKIMNLASSESLYYGIIERDLNGSKYYELKCAFTGKVTRKLYCLNNHLYSRHVLKGLYHKQDLSKFERDIHYFNKYIDSDANLKYYAGELTYKSKVQINKMHRYQKYVETSLNRLQKIIR